MLTWLCFSALLLCSRLHRLARLHSLAYTSAKMSQEQFRVLVQGIGDCPGLGTQACFTRTELLYSYRTALLVQNCWCKGLGLGTQACFTRTELLYSYRTALLVQNCWCKGLGLGTQACFTRTKVRALLVQKVQILTQKAAHVTLEALSLALSLSLSLSRTSGARVDAQQRAHRCGRCSHLKLLVYQALSY